MPLIGNIEDLKWNYEEEASGGSKSPVLINTPRLEVRIIVLAPGQCPPYHRHHKEMDEGYLIRQGRGLLTIDGEKFEVRAGDVLLGKRGGYHNLLNIGDEDLIEFNFRGGKMPSGFIAPEDDGETPGVDVSGGTPRDGYIRRNIFDEPPESVPDNEQETGTPNVFATEFLELFAFSRQSGDRNQIHRHQEALDEAAYLVRGEGRMIFHIDGEDIEAAEGDLIHIPGGSWHHVNRISDGDLIVLNLRGGALPSANQWGK